MTTNTPENQEIFSRDFLYALSNWQKGWAENQDRRRVIADELVRQCEYLPIKFKTVDGPCYRKRFIINGEVTPILLGDDFFEGIASWTKQLEYAKGFKGLVRPDTKFVMVFKHIPLLSEVVVNILSLWEDEKFIQAANIFQEEDPEAAKALFNFKDYQSEIILRSTLRGTEIEDIVGISSSFETLCDMGKIPENQREALSIRYAKDLNGIPIEMPTFPGKRITKNALYKTLNLFAKKHTAVGKDRIISNLTTAEPHKDDLKHKPKKEGL